jgi:uncharacterized protein
VPEAIEIGGLPAPLEWLVPAERWSLDAGVLTIEAGARTDWFADPAAEHDPLTSGPLLAGPVAGDFQLSARVTVRFASTFDAGVLMLHAGERTWAKLCFEYSPRSEPMVVSVVTDGTSDDANGFVVDANTVWLRVARLGPAYAFHASLDGERWELIRHFALELGDELALGFEAQSPTGKGCVVRFDEIRFVERRLGDLRDGK